MELIGLLTNDIEGYLRDYTSGLIDKEETIDRICRYILKRVSIEAEDVRKEAAQIFKKQADQLLKKQAVQLLKKLSAIRNDYGILEKENQGLKKRLLKQSGNYKKKQPKLIPFDANDELMGRIVQIKDKKVTGMITEVYETGVGCFNGFHRYIDLLEDFVFSDGSPCGKMK
jgi:alanyl-tRNA synthetase